MRKEIEIGKIVIYTFLSSKRKMLNLKTISRESKIPKNTVRKFLQNSNFILEAKKRTSRGEILYYLTKEAKSIYKLNKQNFNEIIFPVKQLLSEGNLHEAIKRFYAILKENKYVISKNLISIYKTQLKSLSSKYYLIEEDWKSNKINSLERFSNYDRLVYNLYELLIEFKLLNEEIEQSNFLQDGITIKLNRNFNSFTKEDSNKTLNDIALALHINNDELRLTKIRSGSVMMTIELDDTSQAEKLFLLIKLGKLKEQGVIDARLRELTKNTIVSPNSKLSDLCNKVKSVLKKGKTDQALNLLDKNLTLISDIFHNELFVLYSDFSSLTEDIRIGIVDNDYARRIRNKITFLILNLVDRINKKAAANNPIS